MLKQIGLALHNYHEQNGSFPPAFIRGPDGRPWHNWRVLILPQLDQAELYKQYSFLEPWDGPNNIKLLQRRPGIYDCPTRRDLAGANGPIFAAGGILACGSGSPRSGATTSFAAAFGLDCVFRGSDPVSIEDIIDGLGATIMIGELTDARIPWTKPEDIDIQTRPRLGDPLGFSSSARDGEVQFLLADGSVSLTYWANRSPSVVTCCSN